MIRRKLGMVAASGAALAAVTLTPTTAQAIGDNWSCTTLYGTSGGQAYVCGDYWKDGSLYDGEYEIVTSTAYVQVQINGGAWKTLGGKGTFGAGGFDNARTAYLRACTGDGTGCGGKW
ncbi:hypothetical protein ABZ707_15360 [Streptomyces sp. NPDC006923]|uniref:hypothetical protein n=1 Tax=Streptomyces sp. NPDC006923 TaxID=3155355 RepID=UPI0033E2930A